MTTDDPTGVVGMLHGAFAEQPIPAFDSATRTGRRQQAVGRIDRILAEPQTHRRVSVPSIRWGEAIAVMSLAAALAIIVGKVWPDTASKPPMAAFRAIEAKGKVLCDRNDGQSWTPCEPSEETNFVGLRTLDHAGVTVEAPSGVRAVLGASTTLMMTETNPEVVASRVTLTDGDLDVTVPKLGPNSRFSVVTPTATITVFGTAFSVEVRKSSNQPSRTCVRLREGIIQVTSDGHEERLAAPATWGCGGHVVDAKPAPAPVDIPPPPAHELTPTVNPEGSRRSSATNLDHSTLFAETKLLQRALGAERRGDLVAAEKSLRQLITLYPSSVVTPEARAALERVSSRRNSQERK